MRSGQVKKRVPDVNPYSAVLIPVFVMLPTSDHTEQPVYCPAGRRHDIRILRIDPGVVRGHSQLSVACHLHVANCVHLVLAPFHPFWIMLSAHSTWSAPCGEVQSALFIQLFCIALKDNPLHIAHADQQCSYRRGAHGPLTTWLGVDQHPGLIRSRASLTSAGR